MGRLLRAWWQSRVQAGLIALVGPNYRRAYRLAASRTGLDGLTPYPHRPAAVHTFATTAEDAGIPVRVIDELMAHRAARSGSGEGRGSAIGVVYRHLTPEMQARVLPPLTSAWPSRSRRSGSGAFSQADHRLSR